MKFDADEKKRLDSVERGEWKSAGVTKSKRARYARYADATFKKDRRVNIRISRRDLEAFQKRALEEGRPYQTLAASVLHKYAAGRLRETTFGSIVSESVTPPFAQLDTVDAPAKQPTAGDRSTSRKSKR